MPVTDTAVSSCNTCCITAAAARLRPARPCAPVHVRCCLQLLLHLVSTKLTPARPHTPAHLLTVLIPVHLIHVHLATYPTDSPAADHKNAYENTKYEVRNCSVHQLSADGLGPSPCEHALPRALSGDVSSPASTLIPPTRVALQQVTYNVAPATGKSTHTLPRRTNRLEEQTLASVTRCGLANAQACTLLG